MEDITEPKYQILNSCDPAQTPRRPQANVEPGASPHVLLCFPVAVLEYSDQKQFVGKRIYLLTDCSLSSRDAKTGIQSRNLEPESGAETMEEPCLLACLVMT